MSVNSTVDQSKVEAFVERLLNDTSATMMTLLATIGDRLALFKNLAEQGPATSAEFAERAKIQERYAREWLGGMATAGYLRYDAQSKRFALPAEHVPALAQENGPFFFGGIYQMFPALAAVTEQVAEAFRSGGGVPQSTYNRDFWNGVERFSGIWFDNLLLQQWIPAMPDVSRKLEEGALVADVGCGHGRALIKLAQGFPNSRYVGYDVYEPSIQIAKEHAKKAGVADRVEFHPIDASKVIPQQFDIITTFDVVHDAVDPLGLLRSICKGLKKDGIYICLDVNCSDKLEENMGPLGAMFHGFSVLYCMTTSLANNGAGLGTLGFNPSTVQAMCKEGGFTSVRKVPLENPFNNLYEIRP